MVAHRFQERLHSVSLHPLPLAGPACKLVVKNNADHASGRHLLTSGWQSSRAFLIVQQDVEVCHVVATPPRQNEHLNGIGQHCCDKVRLVGVFGAKHIL